MTPLALPGGLRLACPARPTRRQTSTCLVVLAALVIIAPAARGAEPRVYTTARTDSPPHIDGLLDDAVWSRVEWATDFIQRDPQEGAAPSGQTSFKILYDDDNLYLAYRMVDPEPTAISSILARRDDFPGDWIEINIDSLHDHRTAFSFTSSVSGTQGDEFVSEDGNNWDSNWDPVWELKTHIDGEGWTAEVRIPLGQLRYSSAAEQTWGIEVHRRTYRNDEHSVWQPIPKEQSGWVSQFGDLRGIRDLPSQRRIELLPYSVAQGDRFPRERGNPFADGSDHKISAGIDGKVGLSSSFTADFTINPDFGQVEADPSQVNLTAFETFFSEKRPFFIEGKNIFEYRLAPSVAFGTHTTDRLFYSRRLGRPPHYAAPSPNDGFVDQPNETSILGAAKMTGKTSSGLSIGVLECVAGEEKAQIATGDRRHHVPVEPLSNYVVGRMQRDFREGDTRIGALLTAVNRKIETPELDRLHDAAYTGGFDLYHALSDRRGYLALNLVGSSVHGSRRALLATQTAPARYFQRPDNDRNSVDSTRTSLVGQGGSLRLGKQNGNLRFETGAAWRSPGLELNDIGYMRNADEINQFGWAGYSFRNPFAVFRRMDLNVNQWFDFDFGGANLYQAVNFNTSASFKNNWSYNGAITRENERISNYELRGGPSMRLPGNVNAEFGVDTDGRQPISGGINGSISLSDDDAGDGSSVGASISVRPSNALSIEASPGFSRNRPDMQYIGSTHFEGQTRYLYGAMDQRTFDLSFRVDFAASPNLTLQYYGAPFVSAGRFSDYRRVVAPRAKRYADRFARLGGTATFDAHSGQFEVDENGDGSVDYAFSDPDFNVREFNSNFVLRWQYSPGSSLYLVWSQNRSSYAPDGRFELDHDLDQLFGREPHDVFLIKINRWFDL